MADKPYGPSGPLPRAPRLSACQEARALRYVWYAASSPVTILFSCNIYGARESALLLAICNSFLYMYVCCKFYKVLTEYNKFQISCNFEIQLIDSWGPEGHICPKPRFTLTCPCNYKHCALYCNLVQTDQKKELKPHYQIHEIKAFAEKPACYTTDKCNMTQVQWCIDRLLIIALISLHVCDLPVSL